MSAAAAAASKQAEIERKKQAANWEHLQAREAAAREQAQAYEQIKKGWDQMQQQTADSKKQIDRLTADLQSQQKLTRKVQQQLEAAERRAADAEAKLAASNQEASHDKEQQLAAMHARCEELQATVDGLRGSHGRELEALKMQLQEAQEASSNATDRLSDIVSAMETNQRMLADKQATLGQKEQEVAALAANLGRSREELGKVKQELAAEKQLRLALEAELASLKLNSTQRSELDKIQHLLEDATAKLGDAAAAQAAAEKQWAEKVAALEALMASRQSECDAHCSERDDLAQQVAKLKSRIMELERQIVGVRGQAAAARRAAQEQLSGKAQLHQELADARAEAEEYAEKYAQLQDVIATERDIARRAQADIAFLRSQNDDMRAQLAASTAELQKSRALAKEVAASQEKIRKLKQQAEEQRAQLAEAQAGVAGAVREAVDKVQADSADRIRTLEMELKTLRMMLDSVKIQVSARNKEVSQLRKRLSRAATSTEDLPP